MSTTTLRLSANQHAAVVRRADEAADARFPVLPSVVPDGWARDAALDRQEAKRLAYKAGHVEGQTATLANVPTRHDLATVLRQHAWSAAYGGCQPPCTWHGDDAENEQDRHAEHVADVVHAATLASLVVRPRTVPADVRAAVGSARVRFWQCHVPEHAARRGVVTVRWRDGEPYCTVPGCDQADPLADRP